MSIFSRLTRKHQDAASWQRIALLSEIEGTRLHDYALESDDALNIYAAFARQQEDIIANLTFDMHVLRMERDNEASENVVLKQRIVELEAKLASKRGRKPKTEPTETVGSEATQ